MIRNSSYLKGIVFLFSGSIISQVITFLFTSITSRLFSPEQMGGYTLILSVVNMFGAIVCARYDMVIISSKDDKEVYSLISLSAILGFVSSIIISLGFYIYIFFDIELKSVIGKSILLIFPILLVYSFTNILNAYNNRNAEYGIISQVNVIRVTVQGLLQTLSGFMGYSSLSLVVSYLLSNIVGLKRQAKSLIKHIDEIKLVTKSDIIRTLKKYKNQPIYSVPAIFFNSASYSILPFFINSMFDAREVGLYSMSFRLLGVPLALISTNFSRVFFQKASEHYNINKNFRSIFIKTALFLSVIALPMVIILIVWSKEIIVIVFGSEWLDASLYIRILAPMFGIRLIVSALSVSLIIMDKQKYDMIFQSLFFFATIIIYLVSKIFSFDLVSFILLISIFFSINYLIYAYICYYFSKNPSGGI